MTELEQFLSTLVLNSGRGHRVAYTADETRLKIHARLAVLRDDNSSKKQRKAAKVAIKRYLVKFPDLLQVVAREVSQ